MWQHMFSMPVMLTVWRRELVWIKLNESKCTVKQWKKNWRKPSLQCLNPSERTALQAGRSRVRFPVVSLEFFINIILPTALWSWGRLSLQQKWIPGIFSGEWRRPVCRAYHLHVPIFWNLRASTSWKPQCLSRPVTGIALPRRTPRPVLMNLL